MAIRGEDGEPSPETCVVFFSNRQDGMVIYTGENSPLDFGYIGEFHPGGFADVPEEVIIWLTEGPKEPIYQAIELVDKINASMPPLPDPTLESPQNDPVPESEEGPSE